MRTSIDDFVSILRMEGPLCREAADVIEGMNKTSRMQRHELLGALIEWCQTGVTNYGERTHIIRHLEGLRKPEKG